MKRDKDKELDNLFKNGLGEPPHQVAYQEGDWDAMEQMLNGSKKRLGLVFWLPALSAAAMVLVTFGWWWLAPATVKDQTKPQVAIIKTGPKDSVAQVTPSQPNQPQIAAAPSPEKGNLGNADRRNAGQNQSANQLAVTKSNLGQADATKNNLGQADAVHTRNAGKAANQLAATKNNLGQADKRRAVKQNNSGQPANQMAVTKSNPGQADAVTKGNLGNADNNKGTANTQVLANSTQTKAATGIDSSILAGNKPATGNTATGGKPVLSEVDSIIKANKTEVIAGTKPKVVKPAGDNHVTFALSLIGAPEINGVGSLSDNMRGTNFGLLFSAGIRGLSLTTGATYATKPYGSKYDQASTQYAVRGYLDGVADCRVLDIPINLDYRLINGKQNKFSVGTGISSYVMLHESYLYNYIDPAVSPSTYTVPNVHKYLFSVLNVQATYTRKISPKFGLSVQPYMKLPLTQIGNSKAKLQSAGVALGVSWTLNPSKKR